MRTKVPAERERAPRRGRWAVAIFALALLVYFGLVSAFVPFVIDDTYITFRYADNWAHGGRISFNADDAHPVEGYTSFLWMAMSAAAIRLHLDPLVAMRIVSVASGVGALVTLFTLARLTLGPGLLAAAAPLMLAASAGFAEWSVAGLETVYFLYLLLLALRQFIVELRSPRFPLSAFFFALLALTRPEGAGFFLVALAFAIVRSWRAPPEVRWPVRRVALFAALFGIVYGPYFLWRSSYYGYWFSNSYYAKQLAGGGREYVGSFLWSLGPVVLLAALALVPHIGGRRRRDAPWIPLFAAIIALNFAGIWNVRPAMAWDGRYVLHLLPLFFLLALATVQRVAAARRRAIRIAGALLAALLVAWCAHPERLPGRLAEAKAVVKGLDECHKPLALWLRSVLPPGSTIAVVDTGVIPYLSGLRAIDIANIPLNNEGITHGRYEAADFWDENPRAFVVRGNEQGDLQNHPKRVPLVQQAVDKGFLRVRHLRYGPDYVLYVYADPAVLRRPEGG